MRALLTLIVILLVPVAAGCGNDLGDPNDSTRGLPSASVSAESLDVTWALSLREVGGQHALVETTAGALLADGLLEFAADDESAAVLFEVENLDPRATACHQNAVIVDEACIDRSHFPYLIFERSPVLEVYVSGRRCVVPRDGSAGQIMADDEHLLHTVRAVAPVTCAGGDSYVFEIELRRVDVETTFGADKPQLGGSAGEPILIDDEV